MRSAAILRSLACFRLALPAVVALGFAGCSSDTTRFADMSYTGSTRPSGDITTPATTQPAPAISTTTLPPPTSAPAPQSSQLTPPPQPAPPVAANTPPAPRVATSESFKPAPPPVAAAKSKTVHTVAAGDTLHKIARKYQVSVADLRTANNIAPHTKLKIGAKIVVPGAQPQQTVQVAPPTQASQPTQAAPAKRVSTNAKPNPPQPANMPRTLKLSQAPDSETQDRSAASGLAFRLPVHGRIVAGFGPKPSGLHNDGINIAVPEGTPVKAAEDGVVIYANNELKTYGNLVLIKHADGFVTAYAHMSEILVKRDDVVKRGQVIAKSGQTGNVSTPQLHFQIRKNATPVDPMPYLDRSPQA